MNEIELTSVDVDVKMVKSEPHLPEENVYVNTRYGRVYVTIQGDKEKSPFITYPDIGLTCNFNN